MSSLKHTTPSYDLVRDAKALGMTPSALLRKACAAWQSATNLGTREGRLKEELLRDIQRIYRKQYRVHLQAERAKHKAWADAQVMQAAREGKLEEGYRPVSVVRAQQLVGDLGGPPVGLTLAANDQQAPWVAAAKKKQAAHKDKDMAQLLDMAIESVTILRQFLEEMRNAAKK